MTKLGGTTITETAIESTKAVYHCFYEDQNHRHHVPLTPVLKHDYLTLTPVLQNETLITRR